MLSFKRLAQDDLEQVLEWRTSEHVTQYMYTDIEKNIDNQRRWFQRISQDPSQHYWIIQYKGESIGLISMYELSKLHRRASLGFYIGDLNYARLAGHVHAYLYNFAFFQLGLNKLCAEVMEGNDGMMAIHKHHGFTHEATYKQHIYKYDRFHDVYYLELMASTWLEQCKKFHRFTAEFAME